MSDSESYSVNPIGFIRSPLKSRIGAPRQGREGAPDAWFEAEPGITAGLEGLAIGEDVILITWLHEARREVLKVHPRGNTNIPLAGVFTTRSPDRPNPIGLHHVKVLEITGNKLKVGPLEAIDGTPVLDIKPVLSTTKDS